MKQVDIAKAYGVTPPTIFYVKNPQKSKRSTNSQILRSIYKARIKALSVLGNRCCKCGFSDIRALQIDHIHSGGNKERKLLGSYAIYRKIVKNINHEIKNYQCLCANCNWIKRHENNEVKGKTIYSKSY